MVLNGNDFGNDNLTKIELILPLPIKKTEKKIEMRELGMIIGKERKPYASLIHKNKIFRDIH